VLEPTDVQLVVHNFHQQYGRWPMWLSVAVRMMEDCDWPEEEVDDEISEAIRANEVIPGLRGRHWTLALDPAVEDAVAVWLARNAKEANA
jgi:hypothetical protein